MTLQLLLTLALGGLATLDATPVAQTLLSQPLVTNADVKDLGEAAKIIVGEYDAQLAGR